MSINQKAADRAEAFAAAFANIVSYGDIWYKNVTGLVCDLGHFPKIRPIVGKQDVIHLFEIALGAWLAEDDHPEGERFDSYLVTLAFENQQSARHKLCNSAEFEKIPVSVRAHQPK